MNTELLSLIENADLSNKLPCWDHDMISEELFNCHYLLPYDVVEEQVSTVWLISWICTDTTVGLQAYYLDDEFFGVSIQTSRKGDPKFFWKDAETKQKLYLHFLQYIDRNEVINVIDELTDIDIRILSEQAEEVKRSARF